MPFTILYNVWVCVCVCVLQGVGVVAGTEDCSQYVLLDVNNLELSLVRGAGEDQYHRNVAELRRLNAL